METQLFNKLKSGVALVSNRIYAGHAPQDVAKPYIVYHKLTGNREYTHEGYAGFTHPHFQISCFATTYEGAKAVAGQVISTIESWPGVGIQAGFIDGESDMPYERDTELFHVALDAIIWNTY